MRAVWITVLAAAGILVCSAVFLAASSHTSAWKPAQKSPAPAEFPFSESPSHGAG